MTHEFIPGLIRADGWDQADTAVFQFLNAEFLRDFGPWVAGEKCVSVAFDYQNQNIESYDSDGNVTKQYGFRLEPEFFHAKKPEVS